MPMTKDFYFEKVPNCPTFVPLVIIDINMDIVRFKSTNFDWFHFPFLPEAIFGLLVLPLPASVCVCIHVSTLSLSMP